MAAGTTIKLKRKAGAFTGGDLATGEPGIDTTNSKLYASKDGTTVFEVGAGGGSAADSRTWGIDGGGSEITTGLKKAYIYVPWNCTITAVTLLADQTGSIVLDLWKGTYASLPTIADTITASAKPTLSAARKATDSTLTGWTTSLSAGDIICVYVDSAETITAANLFIPVTKS